MNKIRNHGIGAVLTATALAAVVLTGCGTDDRRCSDDDEMTVMFFSTVDSHYHYGSPTGKVVPADRVPASARKAPGYKAPVNPKPSKPDLNKSNVPRPAPNPAPRPPVRTGKVGR